MTDKAKRLHIEIPHPDSDEGKTNHKRIGDMLESLTKKHADGELLALGVVAIGDTDDSYVGATHGGVIHENFTHYAIAELDMFRTKLVDSLRKRDNPIVVEADMTDIAELHLPDVLKAIHDAISAADDPDKH